MALGEPSAALPGTEEKIQTMMSRVERGEVIFHPADAACRDQLADKIMVYSGLSVVVCGHLIALARDEIRQVAQVTVTPLNGSASPVAQEAVKVAASLLAQQAARFLGQDWAVREWEP